ncbi:MAG: acylphosphatase [Gammaproteobacteria bacterium]
MTRAKQFFVSGRVQGVWFRGSTQAEAERLGLAGSAVNLPDGRVEVLAVGAEAAVMELAEWLHQGPRLARVDHVEQHELNATDYEALQGFTTG